MTTGLNSIGKNIEAVRERIAAAAVRSGRKGEDVKLVCVTKTRTAGEIKEALEAGVLELGENRVQEMLDKYDKIQDIAAGLVTKPNIVWNFIGHLQRNKVKYVIGKTALIHSVDSFRLAEEIDARTAEAGGTTQVLIQLNPAGETQKSGIALLECEALVDEISSRLSNIKLRGLMAMAPMVEDPEDVRGYFRSVKQLFDTLVKRRGGAETGFEYLSMGMTHDFEVAIEEGANIVRVGTAIFSPHGDVENETEGLK